VAWACWTGGRRVAGVCWTGGRRDGCRRLDWRWLRLAGLVVGGWLGFAGLVVASALLRCVAEWCGGGSRGGGAQVGSSGEREGRSGSGFGRGRGGGVSGK
jgi:hypothetical protein